MESLDTRFPVPAGYSVKLILYFNSIINIEQVSISEMLTEK